MSEKKTDLKKQWYSLKWKLAILISMFLISGGLGSGLAYHYLIKPKEIKEIEVIKEVEVIRDGFDCAFIDCYEYRGIYMFYKKHTECCHTIDLVLNYKDKREYYVLRNSIKEIGEIYGKYYKNYKYKDGKLYIQLGDWTDYGKTWDDEDIKMKAVDLCKQKKYIQSVYKVLDYSETELMIFFSEQSFSKDNF